MRETSNTLRPDRVPTARCPRRGRRLAAAALVLLAALVGDVTTSPAQPESDRREPRMDRPRDGGDRPRLGDRLRRFRAMRDRDQDEKPEDRRVPPDLIEDIMSFVRDKLPERLEQFNKLRERNPERFEALIKRMAPTAMEYFKLREEAPELAETIIREFKNQEKLHDLARQYQAAEGDAARQSGIEKEITELVRNQEEFLQERIAHRLKDFEERLKRQQMWVDLQRKQLEREKARMEERVSDRVDAIKLGDIQPPELPIGRFGGPGGPGEWGDRPPPGNRPGDILPRRGGRFVKPQDETSGNSDELESKKKSQ